MAYIHRTITAGALIVETIYPAANPRDGEAVRRGKKALSTPARQKMNLRHTWQHLELELAANFGTGDLWVTFTYDDKHLPTSRDAAKEQMAAFFKKLRAKRLKRKAGLHYVYCTEHKHGDGRWHHHAVIDATGADFEEIRALWRAGQVDIRKLRVDREKDYGSIARYMCKEQRDKIGHRLYSCSRNLRKPERDCRQVVDSVRIKIPRNALILEDTGDTRTAYGHYQYVKYIMPGRSGVKVRAKRRR